MEPYAKEIKKLQDKIEEIELHTDYLVKKDHLSEIEEEYLHKSLEHIKSLKVEIENIYEENIGYRNPNEQIEIKS